MLVTVLAAVGAYWFKHRSVASLQEANAIAVLPLQNMNGDFAVDYLRFALADELTSVLTYSRSLEVRPSSVTRKYVEVDLDPRKVGQELHVGKLLTGHFMRQGEQLTVTLEAIDVSNDRLLWQANVTSGVNDVISLQNKLTTQVQQGLLPVLGAGGGELSTASRPKSPEAYDLYLHSLALPHDRRAQQRCHRRAGTCSGRRSRLRTGMGGPGEALLLRFVLRRGRRGEYSSSRTPPTSGL